MSLDAEQRARYARQILLPELALEGQLRIVRGRAAVAAEAAGSPLAHQVAERYARRAGFEQLSAGAIDLNALAPVAIVRHDAPRAVLAGARAALAAIRDVAGVG